MRNHRVHLGLIGMGYAGFQHYHCAAALPMFHVAAVAEPGPVDLSSLVGDVSVYHDWRELLVHPGLDAVSICTPHQLHGEMATAALDAALHVLLEKPLASDLLTARTIVEAARRTGPVLMVEMTHHFYPAVTEARRFVTDGQLGRLYAVEDRIIEPVSSQLTDWLTRRETAGGGVALTNGIHMLDRIPFVCGQDLRFHSGAVGSTAGLGDIEDTCAMLLSLEDGTPVQLLAAWPRGSASIDDELTLYGSNGTLRIRAWEGYRFDRRGEQGPWHHCYPADTDRAARVRTGMTGALREFAAAITEGRAPQPEPADALAAQELVDHFYRYVGRAGALL